MRMRDPLRNPQLMSDVLTSLMYEQKKKLGMSPENPAWGMLDDIRIGDRERNRAIEKLSDLLAEGFLSVDEFSSRMEHVQSARTSDEIQRVFTDVPSIIPRSLPEEPRGKPDQSRPSFYRAPAILVAGGGALVGLGASAHDEMTLFYGIVILMLAAVSLTVALIISRKDKR